MANTFTITVPNILTNLNNSGEATATIPDLTIPSGVVAGSPEKLSQLILQVGARYVSVNYFVQATGSVASHDCFFTSSLQCTIKYSDGKSPRVTVAQTSSKPNSGGTINTPWELSRGNTSATPTTISSSSVKNGAGQGCAFSGGWSKANISLRAVVTIDFNTFCTLPGSTNIRNPMCFAYIQDTVASKGTNANIDFYLGQYCSTRYPTGGLSNFDDAATADPIDYALCPCNMNGDYYKEFQQSLNEKFPNLSLAGLKPACLLPSCSQSVFQPASLDKCPVPQCLNIISMDGNKITGNVTVRQDAKCQQKGLPATPGEGSAPEGNQPPSTEPPEGTAPPAPSPTTPPAENEPGFFSKYKWWFLAGLLILIIIIIIIVIVIVRRKKPATTAQFMASAYDTI